MPQLRDRRRTRLSALKPFGAVLALGALTACSEPMGLALTGATVVSVWQTGKTVTDHAMTAATGQDCNFRHTISGKSWCQSAEVELPDPAANLVCYRSIAEVSCYAQENPNETASRRTLHPTENPPETASSRAQ